MVAECGGGKAFYNFMIKSQSFSGSLSLGCDLYKCLLTVFLSQCNKKSRGGLREISSPPVGIRPGRAFFLE